MAMLVEPQEKVQVLKRAVKEGSIRLLFFDLESSTMSVETFYIGNKVHIGPDQIMNDTKIITIQYMYEGDAAPYYLQWELVPSETYASLPEFVKRFMEKNISMSTLIKLGCFTHSDADMIDDFIKNVINQPNTVIVGQNHKDFDHRLLNWRANVLGLTPPFQDMIKVDTLKLAKTAFRAPSYKLDYRSKKYNLGGKIKMEFQDWIDIKNGDRQKLKKMIEYGCKDITDLRSLFWKELPYYDKLPAPLEKLLSVEQVKCVRCEARKERKFDVERIKLKGKNTWKCNNCNNTWI